MGSQLKPLLALPSCVPGHRFSKRWNKQENKTGRKEESMFSPLVNTLIFQYIQSNLYTEQMKTYLAITQEKIVLMVGMCIGKQMGEYYLC